MHQWAALLTPSRRMWLTCVVSSWPVNLVAWVQAKQAVDAMLDLANQAGLHVLQHEGLSHIAAPAADQVGGLPHCLHLHVLQVLM